MKIKFRYLAISLICLIMGSITYSCSNRELNDELAMLKKQTQRANDILEIQNVASLHEFYHNALKHGEELDAIWAKEHKDITWTNNTERYEGVESVTRFYAEALEPMLKQDLKRMSERDPTIKNIPENLGMGLLWYHTLTTPVIEVAGDGQTAKGVWMSVGHVTGGGNAQWAYEKYGMDFVKENGEWKIWHLHTYVDFYSPVLESWAKPREQGGPPPGGQGRQQGPPPGGQGQQQGPPPGAGEIDAQLAQRSPVQPMTQADKTGVFYEGYSLKTVPKMEPRPPEPYYTFSETFSY